MKVMVIETKQYQLKYCLNDFKQSRMALYCTITLPVLSRVLMSKHGDF